MFSAAAETPQRLEYARFTQPYLELQALIFARDSESFIDGIGGLAGRRVASVASYAASEYLRSKAYGLELAEVADAEGGLRALSTEIGRASWRARVGQYVRSSAAEGYVHKKRQIKNISVY